MDNNEEENKERSEILFKARPNTILKEVIPFYHQQNHLHTFH